MKCLISETAGKDAAMCFGLAEISAMPGCIAVADSLAERKVNLVEAVDAGSLCRETSRGAIPLVARP